MRKFFGTDGIRGIANLAPMIPSTVVRVGQVIAVTLDPEGKGIVVGKDPRRSGDMLEAALMAGITSCGRSCYRVGVLPTPGIAYLTRKLKAAAGVVISASHNPMEDNGIKVFGPDGFKLTDQQEMEMERRIQAEDEEFPHPTGRQIGCILEVRDAVQQYFDFLKCTFIDLDLSGMKICLDCANGATSSIAPFLFQELGARVHPIHFQPDGININHQCGALYPETLARQVLEQGAEVGFSFDGDGDRLICVDEQGAILSGDQMLLILARYLKEKGLLLNNLVVTTVMSNLGFFKAAELLGLNVRQTQVGDRYVLEEMQACGAVIGGEDSGHLIIMDGEQTTGDGIFAALRLLRVIREQSGPVSELGKIMRRYPQVLTSVPVRARVDLTQVPQIREAISRAEAELGNQGRVLVRYSGTQLMVRVMVEGPDAKTTERLASELTALVQQHLGA
ncbi:MAG: phosphoglucosamine mutase [bacterium]|nr:phosphoglucosamine mutase [bacterium]